MFHVPLCVHVHTKKQPMTSSKSGKTLHAMRKIACPSSDIYECELIFVFDVDNIEYRFQRVRWQENLETCKLESSITSSRERRRAPAESTCSFICPTLILDSYSSNLFVEIEIFHGIWTRIKALNMSMEYSRIDFLSK